jgi:hypothetical protein
MSRYYEMRIEVEGYDPQRLEVIKEAMKQEWDFDEADEWAGTITAYGKDSLCGGESEEEFSHRIAAAIWTANGGKCEVEVRATYLEELPYSEYYPSYDKYQADPEKFYRYPPERKP